MEEKTITKKEEIEKIIEEKIKGKKMIFTDYYHFGIAKRDISHEEVKNIFKGYNKIFAIEIEKLKRGDIGYELFYKLSNNTSFSIATCPKNNKIIIIHAVRYKRSLEKRIKKFKRNFNN